MVTFVFTKYAEKSFKKLPKNIQGRILGKLKELKNHSDIFSLLKRLVDFEPATHRLRIGQYRLILELGVHGENFCEFLILDAGHRKDIYK